MTMPKDRIFRFIAKLSGGSLNTLHPRCLGTHSFLTFLTQIECPMLKQSGDPKFGERYSNIEIGSNTNQIILRLKSDARGAVFPIALT